MTTYKTLYQQVLLRLNSPDGRALIAAKTAINEAQKNIARAQDFDELIINDTANANTVANQSSYHPANDWLLTRPKDVLSIRLIDQSNSRKLTWVPPREFEDKIPYPEILGTGYANWYTKQGSNYVLIPAPSNIWPLYIRHTQWPLNLANDTDETQYENIDDVIIGLATDIAQAILEDVSIPDWAPRARQYLESASIEQESRPDRVFVAQPFNPLGSGAGISNGEYWNDPFYKG